jgi:hypothetical protein
MDPLQPLFIKDHQNGILVFSLPDITTVLFQSICVQFGIFDTIKIQKKSDKLKKKKIAAIKKSGCDA